MSMHCLGTLGVARKELLTGGYACLDVVTHIVSDCGATCMGGQVHEFVGDGFTLLVALAESHVSIHTWPERMTVQLDVFLCSYLRDNAARSERIFRRISDYFEPTERHETLIQRV